jgi:hypothetical protein
VYEYFTDSDGKEYEFTYLAADGTDVSAVNSARMSRIVADLAAKEEALQVTFGTKLPLTQLEIMRRVTPAEWAAIKSSTIPEVIYFRDCFEIASKGGVYAVDPLTVMGFGLLETIGLLGPGRKEKILNG